MTAVISMPGPRRVYRVVPLSLLWLYMYMPRQKSGKKSYRKIKMYLTPCRHSCVAIGTRRTGVSEGEKEGGGGGEWGGYVYNDTERPGSRLPHVQLYNSNGWIQTLIVCCQVCRQTITCLCDNIPYVCTFVHASKGTIAYCLKCISDRF